MIVQGFGCVFIKQTPARPCTGSNIPNGTVSRAPLPVSATLCLTDGLLCQLSVEKESLTGMKPAAFCHADSVRPEVYSGLRQARRSSLAASVQAKVLAWSPVLCPVGSASARSGRSACSGRSRVAQCSGRQPQSQPTCLTVMRLDEWASLSSVLPPAVSTSPSPGWTVSSVSSPALPPAQIVLRNRTEHTYSA